MRESLRVAGRQARQEVRPLLIGLVLIAAFQVVHDWPFIRDSYIRARPWVSPVVEVLPPGADGRPLIRYGARASFDLRGIWTTWIEIDGVRCCTTKATKPGNYIAGRPVRDWAWADWFGTDWPVPARPFRACVMYDLTASSGAVSQEGPFCSPETNLKGAP